MLRVTLAQALTLGLAALSITTGKPFSPSLIGTPIRTSTILRLDTGSGRRIIHKFNQSRNMNETRPVALALLLALGVSAWGSEPRPPLAPSVEAEEDVY